MISINVTREEEKISKKIEKKNMAKKASKKKAYLQIWEIKSRKIGEKRDLFLSFFLDFSREYIVVPFPWKNEVFRV